MEPFLPFIYLNIVPHLSQYHYLPKFVKMLTLCYHFLYQNLWELNLDIHLQNDHISLHLKHWTLSLFVLVLELDLELDSDLALIPLSLDLDCLHDLLSSLFLSLSSFPLKEVLVFPKKLPLLKLLLPLPYPLLLL